MDKNKLKGRIVEKGYNMKSFSKAISMPERTFNYKMKHGNFGADDIKKVMEVLDIENPVPYFFV